MRNQNIYYAGGFPPSILGLHTVKKNDKSRTRTVTELNLKEIIFSFAWTFILDPIHKKF